MKTLENTVADIGMVMLLIALSATFSYGVVWEQWPQRMAEAMLGVSGTSWVVMLVVVILVIFWPDLALCLPNLVFGKE